MSGYRPSWMWHKTDGEEILWVCPSCGSECNADAVGKTCPAYGCEIEEDEPETEVKG